MLSLLLIDESLNDSQSGGIRTPHTKSIDGMSDERIQRIIESMRDKNYLPKPARREYIAKKNSNKKRPLVIQSGNDKLVQ